DVYRPANDSLIAAGYHPRVVLIGNSITAGWVRAHPGFFTANGFTGRGIGGQTTPQMLARFRQDVIALQPKAVIINAGTNDIAENTGAYDPDFTFGNICSMAEIARANGIKVILSSVLPAAAFRWRPEIADGPAKIDALNVRIKQLAKEKGYGYIDYNTVLRDENGGLPVAYAKDGVHPIPECYTIMEGLAIEAIKKAIGTKK
ncbi:MAG: SGNH/GDSL hydrolase family protein, partial [Rikenellaceae bacterium]|nr:SGNH/GDSL hydrolase family protein [Rikenellaceae bacterium]